MTACEYNVIETGHKFNTMLGKKAKKKKANFDMGVVSFAYQLPVHYLIIPRMSDLPSTLPPTTALRKERPQKKKNRSHAKLRCEPRKSKDDLVSWDPMCLYEKLIQL